MGIRVDRVVLRAGGRLRGGTCGVRFGGRGQGKTR